MIPLKIVIDARMYYESGIGRYIRNLINHLQALDHTNQYFILHLEKDFRGLSYKNNFHKIAADFRWYGAREQISLPRLLRKLKVDLVHFPHFNVPVFYRGKYIVTVHDLIHQHFSMQRATTRGPIIYKLKQLGYRTVFREALKKTQKILVPSNFVKGQLINDWKIDNSKITVTYESVDDGLISIKNEMTKGKDDEVLEKFHIKPPFIFYVGNAHPHKNVEGLIRVFGKLKVSHPGLLLVLSGNDHYFWQKLMKEFPKEGIIYTGYISDRELVGLYKNAQCFVMPSLEEGFGIPLLEAMACGCPIVSSNKGSLPEVGGDAALYFDPAKPDNMIEKISRILNNEKLRQDLVKKGLQRYKQFSWRALAQKTLEAYLQCV